MLICAIHGRDEEIIHLIEDSFSKNKNEEEEKKDEKEENKSEEEENEDESENDFFYQQVIKESIKCHHIDISNYYLLGKYLHNEETKTQITLVDAIRYYNFGYIKKDFINESSFCYLCKYDYYILANIVFMDKNLDINKLMVLNNKYLIQFLIE